MPQDLELEIEVIRRFITSNKQARYTPFVSSPKNRPKFMSDLSHLNFYDETLLHPIKGNKLIEIRQALRQHAVNKGTGYVISENRDIDTQWLPIETAVRETVGYGLGTILVFGAADLIFVELETINHRNLAAPRLWHDKPFRRFA